MSEPAGSESAAALLEVAAAIDRLAAASTANAAATDRLAEVHRRGYMALAVYAGTTRCEPGETKLAALRWLLGKDGPPF